MQLSEKGTYSNKIKWKGFKAGTTKLDLGAGEFVFSINEKTISTLIRCNKILGPCPTTRAITVTLFYQTTCVVPHL